MEEQVNQNRELGQGVVTGKKIIALQWQVFSKARIQIKIKCGER